MENRVRDAISEVRFTAARMDEAAVALQERSDPPPSP